MQAFLSHVKALNGRVGRRFGTALAAGVLDQEIRRIASTAAPKFRELLGHGGDLVLAAFLDVGFFQNKQEASQVAQFNFVARFTHHETVECFAVLQLEDDGFEPLRDLGARP